VEQVAQIYICLQRVQRVDGPAASSQMAFSVPTRELAVDRPLKLGSTVQGDKRNGYYTFKYDFQPDSLQKAEQADIIIFGDETVSGSKQRHQFAMHAGCLQHQLCN